MLTMFGEAMRFHKIKQYKATLGGSVSGTGTSERWSADATRTVEYYINEA